MLYKCYIIFFIDISNIAVKIKLVIFNSDQSVFEKQSLPI